MEIKKNQKNKNRDTHIKRMEKTVARHSEWLQNFRKNVEEDYVLTPRDATTNSSPESEAAAPKEGGLGKQNIDVHVPKDQNFEMCARTKPRNALVKPYRAQNFLVT